ncbi:MAG: tRNA 4-thiouridine(8) synthase ThiI [bacterium]|nr:tRNA 4-thiouridine(8) synthase ThiI [bacterium]
MKLELKTMYNVLVINVDELWLKGMNRPMYFKAIRRHIRELIKAYHPAEFSSRKEEQRIVARSDTAFSPETVQALLRVPGVHSVAPARRVPVSYDAVMPAILEELETLQPLPATFKVDTKRSYKRFPMTSMEVSREIGAKVLEACPQLKANMKTPELLIEIRILEQNIYISTGRLKAMGGLPFGTGGHLISLLSGGFDSPVASYLMSKRGCRLSFIFFYAYPFVGDEVKEKIKKMVRVLGQYQRHSTLYVIGFGEVQNVISKHCQTDYRTLLFRKAMIECSNLLADKIKGDALLTGDALGQVSSQTIGNISALDSFSKRTIFRPLVGYNKIEIINLARKIGTHDISVIPHDDACSLFAPKHPVIRPNMGYLDRFHRETPLLEHLVKCLDAAEVYDVALTGKLTRREK